VTEEGDSVRAIVDPKKCTGYRICHDICPDLFKLDDRASRTPTDLSR